MSLDAERHEELERLRTENEILRGMLATSNAHCPYCGLPADQWTQCSHGFPGCSRMDDAARMPPTRLEAAGEAMWQEESLRCLGKIRRCVWAEESPIERKKWIDLARAAYSVKPTTEASRSETGRGEVGEPTTQMLEAFYRAAWPAAWDLNGAVPDHKLDDLRRGWMAALTARPVGEDALREALAWYGEQARLARLIHSEGDSGRHALADDGGKRAAAALAKPTQPAAGQGAGNGWRREKLETVVAVTVGQHIAGRVSIDDRADLVRSLLADFDDMVAGQHEFADCYAPAPQSDKPAETVLGGDYGDALEAASRIVGKQP